MVGAAGYACRQSCAVNRALPSRLATVSRRFKAPRNVFASALMAAAWDSDYKPNESCTGVAAVVMPCKPIGPHASR